MKTVIIFDQLDAEILFFVLDGDHTDLDGAYINSTGTPDNEADELHKRLYNKNGSFKVVSTKTFPVQAVKDGAFVIVAGFLP